MSNFTTRVSAGIAFISRKECNACTEKDCRMATLPGGSLKSIDTGTLDLDSSYKCVLGQIGAYSGKGSYFDVKDHLGLTESDARFYGFLTEANESAQELTAEWVRQLDAKFGRVTPPKKGDVLQHKSYKSDGIRYIGEVDVDGKTYHVVKFGSFKSGKIEDEYSSPNLITPEDLQRYEKPQGFTPKPGDMFWADGKSYFLDNRNRAWVISSDQYARYTPLSSLQADGKVLTPVTNPTGKTVNVDISI